MPADPPPLSELDKTELLVKTLKGQAAADVTNRVEGADERLSRALRLETRVDAARSVERLNAMTRIVHPTSEACPPVARGRRSKRASAKATPASGTSRKGSSSTTRRRSSPPS
jgi:hypothetical protein